MNIDSLLSEDMMAQTVSFVTTYGLKIVMALVIFLIGKWLAKKVANFIERRMTVSNVDVTISKFVKNILYYILMVVIIIATLGQLGIQTASFVAIVGAAGLAVGLALQGSLSNFASGVLLILFRPIKVGDFAEVAGVAGSIKEISIFATTILTGDNKTITVANSSVMNDNIINYSTQPTRRLDLVVGVSYDANIQQVKDELQALADADKRILKDPAVTIGVSELADSSVNLVFRPWVNSSDYWPVTFDLNEKIKNRFDEVGIGIPYPTMDLNVTKAS
ncbi:MAG: mechanosensitive ion channel family protein [Cellvibrionaceae bacterium]